MRVLVVHNRYRSSMPSGENGVVDDDVQALRDAGLEVETFFRNSDDIEGLGTVRKAALAISPTYSIEAVQDFRRVLGEFQPAVVHLHNPFPLISPWVIRIAKQNRVPVVQTVHNYRHSCPASTSFFRDGAICEDCMGKAFPWPAVVHGCYRDSRPQSLSMAVAARVHRATWLMVDRFLPVSEFLAGKLVQAGVPRDRMTVRPNSTRAGGPVRAPGSGFVFIGRLTAEKGASLLISAWKQSRVWETERLVVAGDGPERGLVVAARDRNVHYEGLVDRARVSTLLDEAAVVVIPSLCYEGFPRLVAEAFERGRPIAATAVGALGDLITRDVGWTALPESGAFAEMLSVAAADPTLEKRGAAARATYESKFTPDVTTIALLEVYAELCAGSQIPDSESHATEQCQ